MTRSLNTLNGIVASVDNRPGDKTVMLELMFYSPSHQLTLKHVAPFLLQIVLQLRQLYDATLFGRVEYRDWHREFMFSETSGMYSATSPHTHASTAAKTTPSC